MTAACISVNNKDMSGFVADILGRGAGLQLRVTGKSMAPAICSGDVVAVEKTPPDALRAGDLIFYRKGERLVLHRILFTQHAGDHTIVFRTKGDAARSLPGHGIIQVENLQQAHCFSTSFRARIFHYLCRD
jgi:signal peptidase I